MIPESLRQPREETFDLTDGEALLDVRGGEFDAGLLVAGLPVAFLWNDCSGSIGQYLVRSASTESVEPRLAAIRQIVERRRVNPAVSLVDQFQPLLWLFAPGSYRLIYDPRTAVSSLVDYSSAQDLSRFRQEFYPFETLILTRPSESLAPARIDHWERRIPGAGDRPVVVTACVDASDGEFVIDGHHKLCAYVKEKMPVPVLRIIKRYSPLLTAEQGVELLGEAREMYRDDYLRLKTRYDVR
jgi:hypothetical protein